MSKFKFTFFRIGIPLPYPIVASSSLSMGGDMFSGLGKMNTQAGSEITSSTISILFSFFILDYTSEALAALYLNLSMNF